jgi:crossover junction endodeoxyribonuclease RuvC
MITAIVILQKEIFFLSMLFYLCKDIKSFMNQRIILGIDPGTNIMGYGIISVKANKLSLVATDVINMSKMEDGFEKMKLVFQTIYDLIEEHSVDEVAIEAPFFGKNVQSMLKLGRAQGIAIAAALHRNLPVTEYSPRKVKQSITGKGAGTKEQVAFMLQRLLDLKELPPYFDQTDALAIAICHHFQFAKPASAPKTKKSVTGWKAYINQNPGKVK